MKDTALIVADMMYDFIDGSIKHWFPMRTKTFRSSRARIPPAKA